MKNMCEECVKTKEYIPVGGCVLCREPGLMMSVKTHLAECKRCKQTVAISVVLPSVCASDANRYEACITDIAQHKELLLIAKFMNLSAVQLYRQHQGKKCILEGLSLWEAYSLLRALRGTNMQISFTPELPYYESMYACWDL